MPIRAQFDTSPYGMGGGSRSSIGDVFGAIQGIQGIASNARQSRQLQEAEEEDAFLNDIYAKSFAGWDGKDSADFQRRNQQAAQVIAKGRPKLYGKAVAISKQLEQAAQQSETFQLDLHNKKLANQKAQVELESDMFEAMGSQQDYMGGQFARVAEGKQTFDDAIKHIRRRGIKANLPKKEDFESNPTAFYDSLLTDKMKLEEVKSRLETRSKELGIEKDEKELEWWDRINQAKINQMNRSGTDRPIPEGGALKDWQKAKVDIDRKFKPIEEQLSTANLVVSALKSGNPAAIEPIKTKIMRMYGEVGTMTDKDINRAGGNPAVKAKIWRWIDRGMKGLPPKQDIDDFVALVELSRSGSISRLNTMLDQQETIYGNRGIDVSDITNQYRIVDNGGSGGSAGGGANTLKSSSGNIYNLD